MEGAGAPQDAQVPVAVGKFAIFERRCTLVAIGRSDPSDAERAAARAPLNANLRLPWTLPTSLRRLEPLLLHAHNESRNALLRSVYLGHPEYNRPEMHATPNMVLAELLGTDTTPAVTAHLIGPFNCVQMLTVEKQQSDAMARYMAGAGARTQTRLADPRVDSHSVRGFSLRLFDASGTLTVSAPKHAMLILFHRREGQPTRETHRVESMETALCYPHNVRGSDSVPLATLGAPTVSVASVHDGAQYSCVTAEAWAQNGRALTFTTDRVIPAAAIIRLEGALTYSVTLDHTDCVLVGIDSDLGTLRAEWVPAAAGAAPPRAGSYERSLLWAGDTPTQVLWGSAELTQAQFDTFGSMDGVGDRGAFASSVLDALRRRRERDDPTAYSYVDARDLTFLADGTVMLFDMVRLVVRRDHGASGAAGALVLFTQLNSLSDAAPIGRLVPVPLKSMQRAANEQPYRYEPYTEHQPREREVLMRGASTYMEREARLNAYFSPGAFSTSLFALPAAAPVAAPAPVTEAPPAPGPVAEPPAASVQAAPAAKSLSKRDRERLKRKRDKERNERRRAAAKLARERNALDTKEEAAASEPTGDGGDDDDDDDGESSEGQTEQVPRKKHETRAVFNAARQTVAAPPVRVERGADINRDMRDIMRGVFPVPLLSEADEFAPEPAPALKRPAPAPVRPVPAKRPRLAPQPRPVPLVAPATYANARPDSYLGTEIGLFRTAEPARLPATMVRPDPTEAEDALEPWDGARAPTPIGLPDPHESYFEHAAEPLLTQTSGPSDEQPAEAHDAAWASFY